MRFIRKKMSDLLVFLAYTGVIYSSIPVAPGIFRTISKPFGRSIFPLMNLVLLVLVLSVAYICYQRFKGKKLLARYAALIVIGMAYAVLLFRFTPFAAEKMHLVEYGILSYFALRLCREIRSPALRIICVIFLVSIIGYSDECIQKVTSGRVYDVRDVGLNAASGVLGLAVAILLKLPY